MEKYLTMHPDQFMSYMRSFPAAEETSDSRKDAFRYAKVNLRKPTIYPFLTYMTSLTSFSYGRNLIARITAFPGLVLLTSKLAPVCRLD